MIGRIFFYPTLAWNVGWSSLTGRPWYDRLDETVLLGALPLRSIMRTVSASLDFVVILVLQIYHGFLGSPYL